MPVRDDEEGEIVCERLRAAGIKCAVEPMPDPNSLRAIWGGQSPMVLMVLVNDSDVDRAKTVLAD
jgi:hypothetical protein